MKAGMARSETSEFGGERSMSGASRRRRRQNAPTILGRLLIAFFRVAECMHGVAHEKGGAGWYFA